MSADNVRSFGAHGMAEVTVSILRNHKENDAIVLLCCSVIRNLASLELNKGVLGTAGACEAITDILLKYSDNENIAKATCRAIGHLAAQNDANREKLTAAGALEHVILLLQKQQDNEVIAGEACWAIQNLAENNLNRNRLLAAGAIELLITCLSKHAEVEIVVAESSRGLFNMSTDSDAALVAAIVNRMNSSNICKVLMKSLSKNTHSEEVSRWACALTYSLANDESNRMKLVAGNVCEIITEVLQNHGTSERVAEWAVRAVCRLALSDSTISRMKQAGTIDTVVGTLQRQAKSLVVVEWGAVAIGFLASHRTNLHRLHTAGACEVLVSGLKRHGHDVSAAQKLCDAMHYMASDANSRAWLGASGACEAVAEAAKKHTTSSESVAHSLARAVGSLACDDDGNQLKLKNASACDVVVVLMTNYVQDSSVSEYGCRAVHLLAALPENVLELGKAKACKAVVNTLVNHVKSATACTEACLAVRALAHKCELNSQELYEAGVNQAIVTALKEHVRTEALVRSALGAIAYLARTEVHRNALGEHGVCDLVVAGLHTHQHSEEVASNGLTAADKLSFHHEANCAKLGEVNMCEQLVTLVNRHMTSEKVVTDACKALVTLIVNPTNRSKLNATEASKALIKAIGKHVATSEGVARWGSNAICALAEEDDEARGRLGSNRACETLIEALAKHQDKDVVVEWVCKGITALAKLPSNRTKFGTQECADSLVALLNGRALSDSVLVWCTKALISLSSAEGCRSKLVSAGICDAICSRISKSIGNAAIVQNSLSVIYQLSTDDRTCSALGGSGACEATITVLKEYAILNEKLASHAARAIAGLAAKNDENIAKFSQTNVAVFLADFFKAYPNATAANLRWVSAAIANVCNANSTTQTRLGSLGICAPLVQVLNVHKKDEELVNQVLRAIRNVGNGNNENKTSFSNADVFDIVIEVMVTFANVESIVENSCWSVAMLTTARDASKLFCGWQVIEHAYHQYHGKEQIVQWCVAAVGSLAAFESKETSRPRLAACESVSAELAKHNHVESIFQYSCFAVANLSEAHAENRAKFQSIPTILDLIHAGLAKFGGEGAQREAYRAIAGLLSVDGSSSRIEKGRGRPDSVVYELQEKLFQLGVYKSILKQLQSLPDNESIVSSALAAIASLSASYPQHQDRFGHVTVVRVLLEMMKKYASSEKAALTSLQLIFALTYRHPVNRATFGSNGVSEFLGNVYKATIDSSNNSEHSLHLVKWYGKTVASLTANHAENIRKLNSAGILEHVIALTSKYCRDSDEGAELSKWFFWTIGNISNSGTPNTSIHNGETGALVLDILLKYPDNESVSLWGCRAIHNLAKNSTCLAKFQSRNTNQIIADIVKRFDASEGALKVWANLAKESVNASIL